MSRTKELEAALAYQANNYTPEQFILLDNMQRGDVTATALRILAAEVRRLEAENEKAKHAIADLLGCKTMEANQ